tara:strand:+ start:203 stop:424 length:222 start_codon:yes stop_codon:yes gene_type:complete
VVGDTFPKSLVSIFRDLEAVVVVVVVVAVVVAVAVASTDVTEGSFAEEEVDVVGIVGELCCLVTSVFVLKYIM